jgi:hypothetical protein
VPCSSPFVVAAAHVVGAVVAFNLANKDSFKNVRNWLEDIKKYKGESLVCKILVGM